MKRIFATTAVLSFLLPLSANAMTTPLFSARVNSVSTATNYVDLDMGGSSSISTGIGAIEAPVPVDGSVSAPYIELASAPGTGTSYTFTLMKNEVATNLSCTISDTNTSCTDTTHTVDVSAGDLLVWQMVPTNSPATGVLTITAVFNSTNSAQSFIMGHTLSFSTPDFYTIMGGTAVATEAKAEAVMPTAGTFSNFYLEDGSGNQTAGNGWTVTLEKNGSDTAITCSLVGAGSCSDLTHSVSYNAGDTLSLSAVAVGTPSSHHALWSIKFSPDIDGESILFSIVPSWATGTKFALVQGRMGESTGEGPMKAPIAFTIKKEYIYIDTAPGSGNSRTGTFRNSSTDTALAATIAGTNTTANDTSDSVSVSLYDGVDWRHTTAGTPTSLTQASISAVMFIAPPATSAGSGHASVVGGSLRVSGGSLQIQ